MSGKAVPLGPAADDAELGHLVPRVYHELRRIARGQLSRLRPGETLNATAVVHEAYLKLAGASRACWEGRGHFLSLAGRVMRQVIVDYARERRARKRGGGQATLPLEDGQHPAGEQAERLLVLDLALHKLEASHPRRARVVECRFFAGLSEEETAEAVGASLRTVQRDWEEARAWLRAEVAAR